MYGELNYNFAFRAVLNEDLNKLKELLKLKVGTYNDKRINSYEKYIDKLSRNKNLLHFAILNNQENIEIIEYLSN